MNKRLITAFLCPAVLGLALTSCGGDDASGPADVAEQYTRAGEQGDGKKQCSFVSTQGLAVYGGRAACEAKLSHEPVGSEASLEYRDVVETGDRARLVEVAERSTRTFELVREDGTWKVSRVGTLRALPERG